MTHSNWPGLPILAVLSLGATVALGAADARAQGYYPYGYGFYGRPFYGYGPVPYYYPPRPYYPAPPVVFAPPPYASYTPPYAPPPDAPEEREPAAVRPSVPLPPVSPPYTLSNHAPLSHAAAATQRPMRQAYHPVVVSTARRVMPAARFPTEPTGAATPRHEVFPSESFRPRPDPGN